MATRGDATQTVEETARRGVSTVIQGIVAGAIEVGPATPVIVPVCAALLCVKDTVDKAKCNKEELKKLHARCENIVKTVIDDAKASKTSKIEVPKLEEFLRQFEVVAKRCATQSRFAKMLGRSRKNSDDIQKLHTNINDVLHVWTPFYQTHPCWVVPRACLVGDLQTVPQSVEGKSLDGAVPRLDLLCGLI